MSDSSSEDTFQCPKCCGDDVYLIPENNFCYCSECEYRWFKDD